MTDVKAPPGQSNEKAVDVLAVEQMRARAEEIKPMFEEYTRLTGLLDAIDRFQKGETVAPAAQQPQRSPGRPRSTNGEIKGRARDMLNVVRENPGIKVAQVGDKLGMKQKNYLYRIKNDLATSGQIRVEADGGLHAVEEPVAA